MNIARLAYISSKVNKKTEYYMLKENYMGLGHKINPHMPSHAGGITLWSYAGQPGGSIWRIYKNMYKNLLGLLNE